MDKSEFHFFHPLRVRYSEVDAQGFVFNANHVVYYQTALTEYFRELHYDHSAQAAGTDFHTVRIVVELKGPVTFDQEVDVHVRAGRIGRSSITFQTLICPKGEDQVLSQGEIVWVLVDQSNGRSAPLPEELVRRLRALEGEAPEASARG
jgi:acyl-CoA thioester hydrolase